MMRTTAPAIALALISFAALAEDLIAEEPATLPEPGRLVESLRAGGFRARWQIIQTLGRIAARERYEPALRQAMKDSGRGIRQIAAIGLVQFGHADKPVIDELIRGMSEPCVPVYYSAPDDPFAAQAALVKLGATAVPALERTLENGTTPQRFRAVHALREIGPAAKSALPALARVLRDRESELFSAAVEAKYRIDGDAGYAIRALVPLLDTEEGCGCDGANRILARMGPDAKEALPALIRAMRKYRDSEIVYDLEVLAPHFYDQVVAALRDAQDDPELAPSASASLRDIRRKRGT